MSGITDLDQALSQLTAQPHGSYIFACVDTIPEGIVPFATVKEDEGITVVVTEEQARDAGLPLDDRFARIAVGVHSNLNLNAIGITATIVQTLASRSIGCNVITGYHHDHLFVDAKRVVEAAAVLDGLKRQAKGWLPAE